MARTTSQGTERVVYVDRATAPHNWEPVDDDHSDRFEAFITNDGWVFVRQMNKPEVRLKIDVSGPRIAITAVVVLARHDPLDGPATVRGSDLRDVPLGQLEDHLNAPEIAAFIRRTLAEAEPSEEGRPLRQSNSDGGTISYKLDGVGKHNRPDTFYEHLAVAWAHARTAGHNDPAVRIANANGVTPAAVQRWAREARARGLMAPSGRRNARNASRAPHGAPR